MYASSFIGTLSEIEASLDRALDLETYSRSELALEIAADAIAAIEDLGELSTTALPNVRLDAYERMQGDEAIRDILAFRVDDGLRSVPDEETVDAARDADRIRESGGTILVPVDDGTPGVRNWRVLVRLLIGWLEELVDGFRRVHRRAAVDGDSHVETVFWTVAESLEALREALVHARTIGSYTIRSVRQGSSELTDGLGRIATAVVGGKHA